jgi:NADH-quinone oxidoreductase subunit M
MIHLTLFLPLVAGLVLLLVPRLGRIFALLAAALTLVLSVILFVGYRGQGFGYASQTPLLEPLGVYYAVGLDGAGLMLWLAVAFTVLLGLWVADVPVRFMALALCMESGLLGIFAATDLILFYVFFEFTLLPSLLMLGLYGGPERMRALYTFALFTLVGSLPMLGAVLAVRYIGGSPSFLLSDLIQHPIGGSAATWAFVGFLLAFGVKSALFPLHAWLPNFHLENHPSGLADAMGTLYKVGIFAFFRWAIPLAPDGFEQLKGLLLFLAAFTALYAAWVAFAARDWKNLLAYGGISHMGLGLLGIFSGTSEGTVGALFLLGASMIYTGAMFLFVGRVYVRTGSMEIGPVRGMAASAPALAVLGLFLVMAMIGLPGLAGFPGELMALLGAYKASPWLTLVGFTAIIAGAAYALTAYQAVFHEQPNTPQKPDLDSREWVFAALAVAAVLLLGLYPKLFSELLEPLGKALASLLGGAS